MSEARVFMVKAMLREMLGHVEKRPERPAVALVGVRKPAAERQEFVRMRPLERRRAMGSR